MENNGSDNANNVKEELTEKQTKYIESLPWESFQGGRCLKRYFRLKSCVDYHTNHVRNGNDTPPIKCCEELKKQNITKLLRCYGAYKTLADGVASKGEFISTLEKCGIDLPPEMKED